MSLSSCIKNFSHKELLYKGDKFHCDNCGTKQVATRELRIKKAPPLLIVHLKRFRVDPHTLRHHKLTYRVPFPTELRIETEESKANGGSNRLYKLKGVVVHMGHGL